MLRSYLPFVAVVLILAAAVAPVAPLAAAEPVVQQFTMPIGDVFEKGLGALGVRLADDGQGVVLYDRVLYEDDGPGVGTDSKWMQIEREKTPVEAITGTVMLKKVLHIDRPQGQEARLYLPENVQVEINGKLVQTSWHSKHPAIPTSVLKKGDNEIVLAVAGGQSSQVKMARREDILQNAPDRAANPPRSFKSTDGGKTWEPVDGEFMIRLHLVQYVAEGRLLSPVFDLGGEQGRLAAFSGPVTVKSVALKADTDTPGKTAVELSVRTGSSPVYEAALWGDWQPASAAKVPAGQRYLQWQATLRTSDPVATPTLKGVTVETAVVKDAPPAWAAAVKLQEARNQEIRYTSIPFQYEDPNFAKMKALREKYKLDEVVAGGKTEFEKLVMLRDWVAHQWKYKAPTAHFPAWDAAEILTLKYGFCVQYAITYMQCATALGYQARFVFGNNFRTGHECCEVWSDDYNKWVFMDPNNNWNYVDPKTGVPMSLLEVRDVILKTYYGDQVATHGPEAYQTTTELATSRGLELTPTKPHEKKVNNVGSCDGNGSGDLFFAPMKWMQLRYVSRNNFYAQPYPVPRTQGLSWDYSDYWIWEDGRAERQWIYRNYTARRSDLLWTINQVCFAAAPTAETGVVGVHLGTVTPYFETFLVNTGNGQWQKAGRDFSWKLQSGKNRLEMRTRNTSGVEGPVSFLELNYAG